LRDFQKRHEDITADDAARIRAKTGVVPGEMPQRPMAAQRDGCSRLLFEFSRRTTPRLLPFRRAEADALLDWCEGTVAIIGNSNPIGS
jgi:hypothetical protein